VRKENPDEREKSLTVTLGLDGDVEALFV